MQMMKITLKILCYREKRNCKINVILIILKCIFSRIIWHCLWPITIPRPLNRIKKTSAISGIQCYLWMTWSSWWRMWLLRLFTFIVISSETFSCVAIECSATNFRSHLIYSLGWPASLKWPFQHLEQNLLMLMPMKTSYFDYSWSIWAALRDIYIRKWSVTT